MDNYNYDECRSFKARPLMFVLSVLLIVAFGLGIIILLVWYLKNKSHRLMVSDNEVLFEQGLLSKNKAEINISSVRTIRVKQSFYDRIFGIGEVEIYTSGDKPEIVALGMPNPNKIRELIKDNE